MQSKVYKLGLIGYFAVGKSKSGGQEAKTCAVWRALRPFYAPREVRKVDTGNWRKSPFRFLGRVLHVVRTCEKIVIFPAQNSVRVLSPLLVLCGKPLGKKLHYVVIGGWLPELTRRQKWLAFFLKKFDAIYVETSSMKKSLSAQEFTNVFVMPNFKELPILQEQELVYTVSEPFTFCTFSRVMKEKGIEDAIEAVTRLNEQAGRTVATLDIYGKIDDGYTARFEALKSTFAPYICYKGVVAPQESVGTLKNYFALLFPTHYATEGIPGTLIDAYAAGVPVISALWANHEDIFIENTTGWGFELGNNQQLLNCMQRAVSKPSVFSEMKPLCLKEAQKYMPKQAIRVLLEQLKEEKA